MRTYQKLAMSLATALCLTAVVAPEAAAQPPSPPQILHRIGSTVDNGVAHVRRDLGPRRRHRRVRRVRRTRHVYVRHARTRHIVHHR